jgi:hypothetical protein
MSRSLFWLSDEQWARIEAHLPKDARPFFYVHTPHGRKSASNIRVQYQWIFLIEPFKLIFYCEFLHGEPLFSRERSQLEFLDGHCDFPVCLKRRTTASSVRSTLLGGAGGVGPISQKPELLTLNDD